MWHVYRSLSLALGTLGGIPSKDSEHDVTSRMAWFSGCGSEVELVEGKYVVCTESETERQGGTFRQQRSETDSI